MILFQLVSIVGLNLDILKKMKPEGTERIAKILSVERKHRGLNKR
jgi:hypothetical protein